MELLSFAAMCYVPQGLNSKNCLDSCLMTNYDVVAPSKAAPYYSIACVIGGRDAKDNVGVHWGNALPTAFAWCWKLLLHFLTSSLPHFLTSLLPHFLTSLLPHFLTSSFAPYLLEED